MENCQRRNNLTIIGLPEQDNETQADLSKLMQDKIFSVIGTSPRSIERMHRLGKKQSKARPVIFRLYDFKEKQEIMCNCPKLKGMNVSISDGFSKSVVLSRKCLWESAKNERSSGKRVRLVYDRLYVDGKAY